MLTPVAVEVSAELGRAVSSRVRDARSCRACASGCSPSSGCRCRRCGCAPGAPGLEGGGSSSASTRCRSRAASSRAPSGPRAGARLGDAVLALLRRYGHELFGLQEAQALLDALERTHPALVREVVPKLVSPVLLTDIARRLVEEGISLRNLRDILGALAEWAPHERDPVGADRARARRAPPRDHLPHAGDGGVLAAYLLDR